MVAHPHHHVGDQQRGDDHDAGLKGFQGGAGQLRVEAEHRGGQRDGQTNAAGHAQPQVTQADAAVAACLNP